MQRLKVVLLALMAVFALSAFASSTAFAAEAEFLPTSSEKYTGTSGPGTLETLSGSQIVCKSDTSEGAYTGRTATVHIDFKECKNPSLGVTCTGLGEAAGVILVLASSALLVYDTLTPTLGVGLLVTLVPVHFSCSFVLIEVLGQVLCLVTPVGTAAKHGEVVCQQSKGDATETDYFEGGVLHTVTGLLTSTNHGAEESSGELTSALTLTTNNITLDG